MINNSIDDAHTHDRFFSAEITPIIKGIAIILMFSLHLLKPEWMVYPDMVFDVSILGTNVSAILARGGDICIGIFAFVTGYGWAESFEHKGRIIRILGGYRVYWLTLLVFAFPMRVLFSTINETGIQLSAAEVVRSIVAYSSMSIRFGWYIYFFALAVITYPYIMKFIDSIKMNDVLLCYVVCIISIVMRISSRIVFTRIFPMNEVLEILSHYFQWMPVVVVGHLSNKRRIIDRANNIVSIYIGDNRIILYTILIVLLYVGKCSFMFISKTYSNFDSLIILPFMISLIGVARWLSKYRRLKMILSYLGYLSMYLWLSHGFILYPQVQAIVLCVRLPILILLLSFAVMIPIAYILRTFDRILLKTGQRIKIKVLK